MAGQCIDIDAPTVWDMGELTWAAGRFGDPKGFVHYGMTSPTMRDGVPPDGSSDREAFLRRFWADAEASGKRGLRPLGIIPLSPPMAAVALAIGATMSSDPREQYVVLRTPNNQVLIDTVVARRFTGASFLDLRYIEVLRKNSGLGQVVCEALADWAGANGMKMIASTVISPGFFESIGWRDLDGDNWGPQPKRATFLHGTPHPIVGPRVDASICASERAVFLTDAPRVAGAAAGELGRVMEVVIDVSAFVQRDYAARYGTTYFDAIDVAREISDARAVGASGVLLRNIRNGGVLATQALVIDEDAIMEVDGVPFSMFDAAPELEAASGPRR